MYGNKRKEKKNKKNVIKMYKVTYLRALSAATKDTGGFLSILLRNQGAAKTSTVYSLCGFLSILLRNQGAAKTRTVYSLCTLVGFENIRLEVFYRGGKTIDRLSSRCPLPVRLLECSNYCGDFLPTKCQRVFTVSN